MKRIVSILSILLMATLLPAQIRPLTPLKVATDSTKAIKQAPLRLPKRPAVGHYTLGIVIDGDTIPYFKLPEVKVYASGLLLTQKEIQNNRKLIRNVKLMLPYAQEGKRRLDKLEVEIAALPKKQRKAAIKQAEEDLLRDYKARYMNIGTVDENAVLFYEDLPAGDANA